MVERRRHPRTFKYSEGDGIGDLKGFPQLEMEKILILLNFSLKTYRSPVRRITFNDDAFEL
jgi:hypothetical protein